MPRLALKPPAEFRALWAIGDATSELSPVSLTYSKERGFFEPITNRTASEVIGNVISWRYRHQDNEEDGQAYYACIAEAAQKKATKP